MRRFAALAGIAVGLVTVSSASALEALFDFGNNASPRSISVTNPDENGNNWNSVRTGVFYTTGQLIDTDGTPNTLQFGFTTPVGSNSYNGPAGPTDAGQGSVSTLVNNTDIDAAALGDLGVKAAAFDYFNSDGSVVAQFDLLGLDPTKQYTITFFGSQKYSADPITRYSAYSDAALTNLLGTTTLQVRDLVDPSLHNRDRVATLSGLVPDANGILRIAFSGTTVDEFGNIASGYLNDFKITDVVPEPTTLTVLGAAGALMGRRRRK